MAVVTRFRSAGLSDPGRKRENNEDRFHADAERGIFFVIDGVGGHAAGEKAADTAYEFLRARLERATGTVAVRIREAITVANNEIYRLAQANDDWHGMACVLTVAVVEENEVHIGQVGDSRLYLIQPGEIRKITHDHSPVGEREDRGEIDEISAMRHPRRNEVYRDVGTTPHSPDDADFIEVTSIPLPADGVLLLCSDGLSDLVTSKQLLSIVEAHAGDPGGAAATLIDAANEAGGKDNITAVIVEGPRFAAGVRRRSSSPRTTIPLAPVSQSPLLARISLIFAGLLLGAFACVALFWLLEPHFRLSPEGVREFGWGAVRQPRTIRIANDINSAIQSAQPGDTVLVAPGSYDEQIRLRDGVSVVSERPGEAIIRSKGVAVSGEDLKSGRLEGFRIQPDDAQFLQTGVQLVESSFVVMDCAITGTVTSGIEVSGSPGTVIRANRIAASSGSAITISGDGNGPRIVFNELSAPPKSAAIMISSAAARPLLSGNVIRAAEPVFAPPLQLPHQAPHLDAKELLRDSIVVPPENSSAARPNARPRVR